MKDPGVDGGSKEIVGDGDGMDVASEVEVELLHGDDLGVACVMHRS